MSIKPSGFTWTCDWCETTAFSKSAKEPPENWRKPNHKLHALEATHVCSEDCEDNLYKADDIAHNLGNALKRLIRYHWGKPDVNVPSLEEVSVQIEQANQYGGKPSILLTPVDV